jgi:hypothetical protein
MLHTLSLILAQMRSRRNRIAGNPAVGSAVDPAA